MRERFKHLTKTDRLRIETLLRANIPPKDIAKMVHKHISTIYREMKRGEYEHLNSDYTMENRYSADKAQIRAEANFSAMGAPLKIGSDFKFAAFIERKIMKEKYSPGAALGEIETQKLRFDTHISVKTLYNYIEKGVFFHLTNKHLPLKGRKKKKHRKVRIKRPPKGESIENRPTEVETREIFGHWEMDTVYSKKGGSKKTLLVLSERKTREEIVLLIPDRTAPSVIHAMDNLERRYGQLFPHIFKTITVDNGGEFSDCEGIERSCLFDGARTKLFYCHPYTSCERGTNENINGMIRRIYPKGTSFGRLTKKEVEELNEWVNTYPRGIFGFRTASELFSEELSYIKNFFD